MKITKDIHYVGVDDKDIRLFEGQYKTDDGMCYNSYVITDEKIAVTDTVDMPFFDSWIENIKSVIGNKSPDYLIINHMEPDHSSNIYRFAKLYKDTVLVANEKAFMMCKQFFDDDFKDRRIVVKDGDSLFLGRHTLNFIFAPMVHWPEAMVTYDTADKVLFSADAFGRFGVYGSKLPWIDEARRYYIGIVGKFGKPVSNLLSKLSGKEINIICPLHGNVLTDNLSYYIDLYVKWSGYIPEEKGILIAYNSIYKNTEQAVFYLKEKLSGLKVETVNLATSDKAQAVALAFKYNTTVFAAPSYNGGVFPYMRDFILSLAERNFGGRNIAFIQNGSWAPSATKTMKELLDSCKNLQFAENEVTIMSALNQESKGQLDNLCLELIKLTNQEEKQ